MNAIGWSLTDFNRDSDHPVSNGILTRCDAVVTRNLPPRFAVGVTQVEDFDPQVHDDVYESEDWQDGDGNSARKGEINVDVVKEDPFEPQFDVVEDRITWPITKVHSIFRWKNHAC